MAEEVPVSCSGCVKWEKFGRQCHYFWEGKKFCTQHARTWDEVPPQ